MIRIAITGPESSGKTTLANELAIKTKGSWIPEFAREFLNCLNRPYTKDDLDTIAKGQLEAWEAAPESKIQFCDTEMLVLKVWSDFKFGTSSVFIMEAINKQQFDHYFLCKPDIIWEEDPLREHPEQREELFELYLAELINRNLPFTVISGSLKERVDTCLQIVQIPN